MACYATTSERSQVAGCYDSRGGEKWLLCRCCWEEQGGGGGLIAAPSGRG